MKQMTTNVPVPFADMERMANSLVKSRLFGLENVDQALALMAIAVAEGKHPALIAKDFDIIQGKAAKKPTAMLRDFIAAGGTVEWHKLDDTVADATFTHPAGGKIRIAWDMKRATQAGLAGKENYRKYPRSMLRSRCVSEGIRTVFPGATSGVYTPEEVTDMVEEAPAEINVTPDAPAALSAETRAEHEAAIVKAADLDELRQAYTAAYLDARRLRDVDAMEAFGAAKERRKLTLSAEESQEALP